MSLQRVLNYYVREIADSYVKENFQRIREFLRDDPWQKGEFKVFTIEFPSTLTFPATLTPKHFLNFTPRDVVMLSVVDDDGATITWHYDDFNAETVKVQASAACTVRAFIGRYEE